MKKKLSSKKCIAVVLAAIMVITSIPFMLVSALTTGAYDPAPYWGEADDKYGAINTNFVATLNTDGSISISFPDANAQKTYDGSANKTIAKYVFTLTKLSEDGSRKEIYSEVFDASAVATGDASAKYPNNIYYGPGGLESLPDYDVQSTYDVAIHAIDSDGWFSDKIHTLLSDVPYYNISADFSPTETWVAREMLLFSGAGSQEINGQDQTSDGKESGGDYQVYSGSKIDTNGYLAEMGYDKTVGGAYRFWINGEYDGTPYSVQTTWSRSHYNFTNAEEVWFYVDFSRVNVTKVAFSLSANEKYFEHKKGESNTVDDVEESKYGALFSTKAVNGVNTGVKNNVYLQNADGLWIETNMTDGYFTDLGGYKGFVRIPIDYFVLQSDQYITADNNLASWSGTSNEDNLENYLSNHWFASGSTLTVPNADGTTRTITSEYLTADQLANYGISFWYEKGDYSVSGANAFKVNSAGTSVRDAHIINQRIERTTTWTQQVYKRSMGTCLSRYATVSASGTSYTVTSPYFAIQDMVSAGIEVAGWTSDSVAKSFYVDQVMFCQYAEGATFNADGSVASTSSVKFPDEGGDFAGDLGKKVAGYYDRTVEVPKAIANYIMEYVGAIPSLDDMNALDMIDDIILTYRQCFPAVLDTDSDETVLNKAIAYMNNTLGYSEAVRRYNAAKTFIATYVDLGDSKRNYNAVVTFETGVEKLPSLDYADYSDEELKTQLEQLMALYKSFNLSHFEILGQEAEAKFTELYSIMMGEEVKTGYSIGGYPYIPFNDFEKTINGYNAGYSVGQQSLLYYDDYPNNSSEDTKRYDVNNTKNFTTYVTSNTINQTPAVSGGSIGWSIQDYRASIDGGNNALIGSDYFGRMEAEISNNGFAGSLGATIKLDGDLNSSATPYKFAVLSTTYKGQNVSEWSNLEGLNLSALAINTTTSDGLDSTDVTRYNGATPNSFVMYVDFTEVTGLVMNIKFILRDPDGYDVNCYFCAGYAEENPIIYLLDENGEWEEQALAQSNIDTDGSWFGDSKGVCSIAPSSLNSLEGYKGFIRIPLSNFRVPRHTGIGGSVVNNEFLDNLINSETYGDWSIVQAKVAFWDYTGANVGKDVTIDAMGFTYDPACTTRKLGADATAIANKLNLDNGITVTNMDEYFAVKTNDSVNFEKMVAELDPYVGREDFVETYEAAYNAYWALSPYQRGEEIKEVKYCYEELLLDKYSALAENDGANYDTIINQPEWKCKYQDTEDASGNVTEKAISKLIADIEALHYDATGFISTNYPLPSPYNESQAKIVYPAFGINSKADAEEIISMYVEGYDRMSKAQRSQLTEAQVKSLENAYAAAQRVLLVEDYLSDITAFKNKIIEIYTAGTAEPDVKMVKYDNTALLDALTLYENMSVFAKEILGEIDGEAYKNMYEAAEAIYDNSHTITMSNGTVIDGGVLVFEDRMNTCATDVEGKINARTVLDAPTLNEIEYCLGQTESFLPRYAQVDEINIAYHNLADLLPFAEIASVDSSNATLTTITLNNDDVTSYTAYIDLSYIATRLNRNVALYAQSDLKWTQTTGTTYDAFEYYSYGGLKGSDEQGVITTQVGTYTNGDSSSISKYGYTLSVDATEASLVPTGAEYTSTLKFYAVDPEVIAEKTADGTTTVADVLADSANVLDTVEVTVKFVSTNGTVATTYEVSFPAAVSVPFGETNSVTSGDITITHNMPTTKQLSVALSETGGTMVIDISKLPTGVTVPDPIPSINYTASFAGKTIVGAGTGTDSTDTTNFTVTVAESEWKQAYVNDYIDSGLTFTVACEDVT